MWIAPERRRAHRWIAPVFAVAAGVAVAATVALRGQTETGLVTLAVLLGYGILLGARGNDTQGSETFGGSGRGGGHTRAAAATADVLVAVIVAALIVQALRGAEIWVLAGLAGVACVTYLIAVLSISWY
jgi:hypothetical protein